LITNDGYQITPNKENFSAATLKGFDVLVISNALGAERMNMPEAANPAFTIEECDAVRDWVKGGGHLLLIADHAPMGSANQILAERFGVNMSKCLPSITRTMTRSRTIRASSSTRERAAGSLIIQSPAAVTTQNA